MRREWLELSPCGECGADSATACAPYCTAPDNRTGKRYVLNRAGRIVYAVGYAAYVAYVAAVTLAGVFIVFAAVAIYGGKL